MEALIVAVCSIVTIIATSTAIIVKIVVDCAKKIEQVKHVGK